MRQFKHSILALLLLLLLVLSACTPASEPPAETTAESTAAEAESTAQPESTTAPATDSTDSTTEPPAPSVSLTVVFPAPAEPLVNFPALITLDGTKNPDHAPLLDACLENGSDLTVAAADGSLLAHELASFSKAEQKAEIWVLLPDYRTETAVTLSCGDVSPTGTVFGSEYKLVLHMSDDTDSSPTAAHVDAHGKITLTSGAIGDAMQFDGSSGYLTAGTPLPLLPESAFLPTNNPYTDTGYRKPTNWEYAQGLTTDGEYLYFAGHFDKQNKGASIHKIRMSDMVEVAVFEHAGPMHSAILDYEPETDTIFASTGGDGRAAAVWELDKNTGECLGQWDLRTLGFGGGAGVISLGNREILLYTSASDGAKIAFNHLRLSENGGYDVLSEWKYTDSDLGVGQGLDSLSRSGDGSFIVYYLADAGSSVSVDPHYVYQIRLTPGAPVEIQKRFHISIKAETEGLCFLTRADGGYDVYFGTNEERIYKIDAPLASLQETPFEQPESVNSFTLSFFVRLDGIDNRYPGIIGYGDMTGNKNRFSLHLFDDSVGKLRFGTCLNDKWTKLDTAGGALPKDGAFHHVAAVYDGPEMRLYIDGVLSCKMSVSGVLTDYGAPFSIGADIEYGVPAFFFRGAVDEVRLVSTVRSEAWIMMEAMQGQSK